MKKHAAENYRCPATGGPLVLSIHEERDDEVLQGALSTGDQDRCFTITDGIPDFTWPMELAQEDQDTLESYEQIADDYDKYAPLPFQTYRSDEHELRERMADQLELKPDAKVLEIGCGTGRGSSHIAARLNESGHLYLQELSPKLLRKAIAKLSNQQVPIEFSIANGSYLPFADDFFDAAHHFGGINTFAEIPRCLSELARVVKIGGKVVFGDESMGPWLRDTDFGRIMMNSNPLLKCNVPLIDLPACARDVRVEWVLMGAFFTVDFRVGEGLPEPDYHLQIPSARGGSHWTRYYGNLEGVTDDTKRLAHDARKKSGKSMHAWLDEIVKRAAQEQLDR